MIESYDINDYLKDDKELQAVIQELLKELSTQQGKLDAYQMSENEANEIIAELKEEVKQLHNCRNPEELYTLFGKPIKYWERLEQENKRLIESLGIANKYVNKYHQTLQEIKKIAERQLLVTNVRTYQMVYYADFSEYRNEILGKITKAEEE